MNRHQPNLNINELRCFILAAELGSFTAAAAALGITQSAVTRQIQRIEERLGIQLFRRHYHPLMPGRTGEKFLVYARAAVESFDRMLLALEDEFPAAEGELRIVASTTPGDYLLPEWLREYVAANPRARPNVFITDTAEVSAKIVNDDWDIGFVGERPRATLLRSYAVARDEVVLAVPAGHPFAARGEIDIPDLADQRFVSREEGSGTLTAVRKTLRRLGLTLPRYETVMTLHTTQACLQAVQDGFGIAWVSALGLSDGSVSGVVPVRVHGVHFARDIYLVHARRPLSSVAMAFVNWMLHSRESRNGPVPFRPRERARRTG